MHHRLREHPTVRERPVMKERVEGVEGVSRFPFALRMMYNILWRPILPLAFTVPATLSHFLCASAWDATVRLELSFFLFFLLIFRQCFDLGYLFFLQEWRLPFAQLGVSLLQLAPTPMWERLRPTAAMPLTFQAELTDEWETFLSFSALIIPLNSLGK